MQGSKSCPHKEGPNRVSTRGLMKAAGFTSEEIAQPFVGIACSWTDAFPGHNRLNQLAEDVARGVIARGGTPMIFGGRGTAKSLHHSAARGTIQPGGDQRRTPDGI